MLPEVINAEWIWGEDSVGSAETYVFFRKEFILDETPASADLWITAHTFFHVYINGHHLGYGPATSPDESTYLSYIDANFLLKTGRNVIAVAVHNTSVARNGYRMKPDGLWAQLNIDNNPSIWTDSSWKYLNANCYLPRQARRSVDDAFVECLDFRKHPEQWNSEDTELSEGWTNADVINPGVAMPKPISAQAVNFASNLIEFKKIARKGKYIHNRAYLQLSFQHLVHSHGKGVYAAEILFESKLETKHHLELYTESAYKLFINGNLCKEQGINPLVSGDIPSLHLASTHGQCNLKTPLASFKVKKGWNKMTLFIQGDESSSCVTFVFPNLEKQLFVPRLNREPDSGKGCIMYGPLKTPLPRICSSTVLPDDKRFTYVPFTGKPIDEGALLMSCEFIPGATPKSSATWPIKLTKGKYVVLDLGATYFGCPELLLNTDSDAIVNIVTGEVISEDRPAPQVGHARKTDSLILSDGTVQWTGFHPRGFRYLMILVKECEAPISIESAGIRFMEPETENEGSFKCSDGVLHAIWQASEQTLKATWQERLLDAPGLHTGSSISSCMIQSWSACHILGVYKSVEYNIKEFAKGQLETGEIPAYCHTDHYYNIPDYSLLWPVWLHKHISYTGNIALLKEMLPHLQRLHDYFDQFSDRENDGLLKDMKPEGANCILDFAKLDKRGYSTGLNAIYARSLYSAAWLFEQAGDETTAKTFRRKAANVSRKMNALSWNPEKRLFADSWCDGKQSTNFSSQSSILAVYGGLGGLEQFEYVFKELFTPEEPFEKNISHDTNNPYMKYFLLEAAFALGKREWALNFIRYYWGGMINLGASTWWQFFDPTNDDKMREDCSLCHAYGISPAAYLCTELAGIRPALPGFQTVVFEPLLTAGIDWVKTKIPTVHGHIMVEWRINKEKQLEAAIDASYPVDLIPVLDPEVAESATFHVSDEIHILANEQMEQE